MPGALIDPIGQKPEVLTDYEHERLTECLRAFRAQGELSEVLRNLLILGKRTATPGAIPPR